VARRLLVARSKLDRHEHQAQAEQALGSPRVGMISGRGAGKVLTDAREIIVKEAMTSHAPIHYDSQTTRYQEVQRLLDSANRAAQRTMAPSNAGIPGRRDKSTMGTERSG